MFQTYITTFYYLDIVVLKIDKIDSLFILCVFFEDLSDNQIQIINILPETCMHVYRQNNI